MHLQPCYLNLLHNRACVLAAPWNWKGWACRPRFVSITTSPVCSSRLVGEETAQRKYVLSDSSSLVWGSGDPGPLLLCVSWADHCPLHVWWPQRHGLMQSATQTGPVLRVKGALLIALQEQQVCTGTLPDKPGHMATLCHRSPWVLQGNLHSCSWDTDLWNKIIVPYKDFLPPD